MNGLLESRVLGNSQARFGGGWMEKVSSLGLHTVGDTPDDKNLAGHLPYNAAARRARQSSSNHSF
jgi:hypothetical protein